MSETSSLYLKIRESLTKRSDKLVAKHEMQLFLKNADELTEKRYQSFITLLKELESHDVLNYSLSKKLEFTGEGEGGYEKILVTIQFKNYTIIPEVETAISPLVITYLPEVAFISNFLYLSGKNIDQANQSDLELIPQVEDMIRFLQTYVEHSLPSNEFVITMSFYELKEPFTLIKPFTPGK